MSLRTAPPASSFPNLFIFYLAFKADTILSRCSCVITFPHQSPAAWWLVLTRMRREATVLTGTRGNTSPQQFSVSPTLFRHALHLTITWKECRLPHEEGWVRETAKSAKDLKKTFQKRQVLGTLWSKLPMKKPKQGSSSVCNARLLLPAKDNGQSQKNPPIAVVYCYPFVLPYRPYKKLLLLWSSPIYSN